MSEINKYALYSQNSGMTCTEDEVSLFIKKFETLDSYEEINHYLNSKFGEISNKKTIDYPELNKKIEITNTKNRTIVSVSENEKIVLCQMVASLK